MEAPSEIISCEVVGRRVLLCAERHLFRPTLTTTVLTASLADEHIEDRAILDLGCGIGPIAIGLAMAGAKHVVATDIMPEACELTMANARLNHVADRISIRTGNLFEPVRDLSFDIIVDDVSGVAEGAARLSSWFPPGVATGGPDGTSLTIDILQDAKQHLRPQGYLLFPVLSLSRRQQILDVAHREFGDRLTLLASKRIPFNMELRSSMQVLQEMKSEGLIEFGYVRSRPFWTLEIYKASADA